MSEWINKNTVHPHNGIQNNIIKGTTMIHAAQLSLKYIMLIERNRDLKLIHYMISFI